MQRANTDVLLEELGTDTAVPKQSNRLLICNFTQSS